jgi:hypothetical protein
MRRFTREQRHARRTAQRDGAEVLLEPRPLLRKVFLDRRLVVERVEVEVLVVGHNEDEVWFRSCRGGVDGELGCCGRGRGGCSYQEEETVQCHAG